MKLKLKTKGQEKRVKWKQSLEGELGQIDMYLSEYMSVMSDQKKNAKVTDILHDEMHDQTQTGVHKELWKPAEENYYFQTERQPVGLQKSQRAE